MKLFWIRKIFLLLYFSIVITALFIPVWTVGGSRKCIPLKSDGLLIITDSVSTDTEGNLILNLSVGLAEDFKGTMWLNREFVQDNGLSITAVMSDTVIELAPVFDACKRSCSLISEIPLMKEKLVGIDIPEGMFEISPEYIEVDDIELDDDMLTNLSVAGAWHKKGAQSDNLGLFSIVDDDSLDGQIDSSIPGECTYGYYSLLYPLLESLGLRGNLAVEGRRIGINKNPPVPNDNLKTLVRLQDEKGWDLMSHSMDCIGEILNNWMVDSLNSQLARMVFEDGPNKGANSRTVSVYDLQTHRQYWPNADNTDWEETPARFIKPYVGNYDTKKAVMYNPDFNIDWHWAEWKRRAEENGMRPVGFVTHNATSSHAMVPPIMDVFPFGLSDISTININRTPMLSTGVRSGLEGQSMSGYDGNSKDNTFDEIQFRKFCEQIDETAECGGWIIFNLHAYRDCWLNSLPGALVSQGGTYPDEWVIPMKGVNSANAPLSPPAELGISEWSEWYPCPGTRLEMMARILQYALDRGLANVTCSEGFSMMGNKKSVGYFNQGHKFGMDGNGIVGTKEIYPHYVVSAMDEVYYYNPVFSEKMSLDMSCVNPVGNDGSISEGEFLHSEGTVTWTGMSLSDITLQLIDMTGKEIRISRSNCISLDRILPGMYIVCVIRVGAVIATEIVRI